MKEWYEGFHFTKDEINSQRKITEKAKQALNVKHEYSSLHSSIFIHSSILTR